MKQNIFWFRNIDGGVKLVLLFKACYQRVRGAGCGVRSAECGVRGAGCGVTQNCSNYCGDCYNEYAYDR